MITRKESFLILRSSVEQRQTCGVRHTLKVEGEKKKHVRLELAYAHQNKPVCHGSQIQNLCPNNKVQINRRVFLRKKIGVFFF